MRILIIGAGSIGSFFAAKLALLGNNVYCYGNAKFSEYLKSHHLQIETLDHIRKEVELVQIAPPINKFNTFFTKNNLPEILIIATKAYNLPNIVENYRTIINNFSDIYLLQNGIGNEEFLSKYFPNRQFYRIITTNGAMFEKPGCVHQTGEGITKILPFSPPEYNSYGKSDALIPSKSHNNFIHALEQAGFNPEQKKSTDFLEEVWKKALINIGINPFGALTRLTNGDLLSNLHLKKYIELTVSEAIQIAQSQGIHIGETHKKREEIINSVFITLKRTASNKNSMLQDIIKGKPTEIDFLNGKIVEIAQKHKISVPVNELLTILIKGLEKSDKKQ